MMPSCLLLFFWLNALFILPASSFGQTASKTFPTYDGRVISKLLTTPDGGYLVTGSSLTNTATGNHSDAYLLKLDYALDPEWYRTIGDTFTQESFGLAMMQDGNYVMGLNTYGTPQGRIALVKYTPQGDTLWSKSYIAPGPPYSEFGHDVFSTVEGNVVVVGQSLGVGSPSYGLALFMVDPQGNSLWSTTLTLPGNDYALPYAVTEDSHGNLYISGFAVQNNNGGTKLLVVKYDRNGNQLWSYVYGQNTANYGLDIEIVGDTSLLVIGYGYHQGRTRAMACRLDTSGNPLGQMVHFSTTNSLTGEYADDCAIDLDGNFLVTGNINRGQYKNPFLVKFDPQLDTVYTRLWNRQGNDDAYDVLVTRTSSGIVTAYSSYDFFTAFPNHHNIDLLDPSGYSGCNNFHSGLEFFHSPFSALSISLDALAGRGVEAEPMTTNAPSISLTDPCGAMTSVEEVNPSLTIFPNPGTDRINFEPALNEGKIRIVDLQGRILKEVKVERPLRTLELPGIPTGVYLLEYQSYKDRITQRLIIR